MIAADTREIPRLRLASSLCEEEKTREPSLGMTRRARLGTREGAHGNAAHTHAYQLHLKCASVHVDEHERNVVGRRAFAPRGDAIENSLLHMLEWEQRGLADEFLHTFDA
jgi:hypothetical protein